MAKLPVSKGSRPFAVRVTARDIRGGTCGDMFKCAVAAALQRAAKDTEAHVYSHEWELRLMVWGRTIYPPGSVRQFVHNFDHKFGHTEDSKPILPKGELPRELKPFTFTLPPITSAEWEEHCYHCEQIFAQSELDDEGCCPECAAK